MLAVLVACGGDDSGDTTTTADTATTTTAGEDESPDTTAADMETTTTADEAEAAWQEVVDAAEEEGEVVFFTAFPNVEIVVPEAFMEAYPNINVVAQRIQTADLLPRLEGELEADADGADVALFSGTAWWAERAAEGNAIEITGPAQEGWNDTYFAGNYLTATILPLVFGFNTDAVEPFTDWQQLLDPAYADGNMGTCEPRGAPIVGWYKFIEDEFGEEYLDSFAAQQPVQQLSTTTIAQQLAAGELDVGACMTPGAIQGLIDDGAPVNFTVPEPAFGLPGGMGILGNAKRPNAAQVFINWIMTPEGQTAVAEAMGTAGSPLSGIENAIEPDALVIWQDQEFTGTYLDDLRNQYTELLSQ